MQLEKNHIYHIYNQGNNRQKIFFNRDNYMYFLQKMNVYLIPYCDILAWCLMPNHFHWMLYVKETELDLNARVEQFTEGVFLKDTLCGLSNSASQPTKRTLNNSIGYLIRSYTQAINKQNNFSGSLFRKETKAECITKPDPSYKPSFFNTGFGTEIIISEPEKEYPQVCFNYIHENPVRAHLVKRAVDWEFSSARDICGIRNGKLINRDRIDELNLHL